MGKMKCGKAAGPSGVVVEMFRASKDLSEKWITDLCNDIIDEGCIPSDWKRSILVPVFKGKGDPMECGSYRAIKLLDQGMKVMERVLESRVREQVHVDSMQFGFMPGKGTTDAIFVLRQLMEKHLAKRKRLYFAFVDLEKAFDRVPREVVRWALRKAGVEEWLVQAVMLLYTEAQTVVRTEAGDSKSFEVKVGVHQGSVLSPLLFAVVMDQVTKESREGLPWELLYADDLVLIAPSKEELQRKLEAWRTSLVGKGLKVNAAKSKIMIGGHNLGKITESGAYPCGVCGKGVDRNSILCTVCDKWIHYKCSGIKGRLKAKGPPYECSRCKEPNQVVDEIEQDGLTVQGEVYQTVKSFCYLGDTVDAGGGVDAAVTARIRSGWNKFRELRPFLTSRAPSLKTKGTVYASCIRSCMTYGCETWAMKVEHEIKMERAESRMLRWMCGVSLKDKRRNEDLRKETGIENIRTIIRRARLRWFGHVFRMDDTNEVKKVMNMQVEGRTPVGRPKLTWEKVVDEDIKRLKWKKEDANDREKWRNMVRDVQPQQTGMPDANR